MTDATELDIDAIRARVEAATEGPWEIYERSTYIGIAQQWGRLIARTSDLSQRADAEFIAHARTDLPAALDEITRLRAALDEARAELERVLEASACNHDAKVRWFHRAEAAESALAAVRALHRSDGSGGMGPFCVECARVDVDGDQRWPCVTIRTLDAALATPTTTDEPS